MLHILSFWQNSDQLDFSPESFIKRRLMSRYELLVLSQTPQKLIFWGTMSSHAEQLCKVRYWRQLYCQLFLILCTLAHWVSFAVVLTTFKADLDSVPFYLFPRIFDAFSFLKISSSQSHQLAKIMLVSFTIKQWMSIRQHINITCNKANLS